MVFDGVMLTIIFFYYNHIFVRMIGQPGNAALSASISAEINRYLDRWALLSAPALADRCATSALVDTLPDRNEDGLGQSRDMARMIVAKMLSAPNLDTEICFAMLWWAWR
jgi:hypothetical protein